MNKAFASASFDLSSTPDVVWALPPTVGAPFIMQPLHSALLKTLGRLTFLANPFHSPHNETLRNNKFILGGPKNNHILLAKEAAT